MEKLGLFESRKIVWWCYNDWCLLEKKGIEKNRFWRDVSVEDWGVFVSRFCCEIFGLFFFNGVFWDDDIMVLFEF